MFLFSALKQRRLWLECAEVSKPSLLTYAITKILGTVQPSVDEFVCSISIIPFEIFMSAQPEGWGRHIVFGADPAGVCVGVRFSAHYLLNQLMGFDQTCIDTLLGVGTS